MNSKVIVIYQETVQLLSKLYDLREAESITNRLFEDLLGINKITRLTSPDLQLSSDQLRLYSSAKLRLAKGEPVQYITGKADFYGRIFEVNPSTLIPRNETEELVDLILSHHRNQKNLKVLDIGTGSGCIAISLALGLNSPGVLGWDISEEALATADKNAQSNQAAVRFERCDILGEITPEPFDIIVSNPPYIPNKDKASMHRNVLDYEPREALFVPDNDPLIFYRHIAEFAKKSLQESGKLYFEIHETYGLEVEKLLEEMDFQSVELIQDLNEKDRIVWANFTH